MSYYINLQRAIDYIEDNLGSDPELEKIAKIAGYSIPHFYRVFGAIVGCSVKEYIRRRKLSNAMYAVITTKRSIIDIAFEYGFESHEVFTRAFKLVYGAPPSYFRKTHEEPKLYEKVNLLSNKMESGVIILKPMIICKEERQLVGIARKVNQEENQKFGILDQIQKEFKGMADQISHRVNPTQFYAAYDYQVEDISKDDENVNYTYYFCVEVSECKDIPSGMVGKVLPKAKYAVFSYEMDRNTLNGEVLEQSIYDYIDGIWLPNSGFELSEESDFEVHDEENCRIDYYISIK
ncbi:MAG TPA: helix-turn-helix domain-containing protein [Lachnospiraceae bacterium]|nr:helix-turn-helix domain-containing protein [Lachnospiraceae bacterium]